MEMQVVFEVNLEKSPINNPLNKYIIMSILFTESDIPSKFLDSLKINNMPKDPGYKKNIDYNINMNVLFTDNKELLLERFNLESFYMYNGSFTTPNCEESVTWII